MSLFKSANKPTGGVSVSWDPKDPKIEEGKKKYFGNRIVGKFLQSGRYQKGHTDSATYTIHLYADMNDESKFGQDPDGEVVTVWGAKLIDDAFAYGGDGNGIQPGDIVEIVYNGYKDTVSGDNRYQHFDVGSMRPTPSFTPAQKAPAKTGGQPASAQLNQFGY